MRPWEWKNSEWKYNSHKCQGLAMLQCVSQTTYPERRKIINLGFGLTLKFTEQSNIQSYDVFVYSLLLTI